MKTVQITETIRCLGGCDDRPWLMIGNDKKQYVVKFHTNNYLNLSNEMFANLLAKKFNLPVSDMSLVHISKDMIEANADLNERNISEGIHLGFIFLPISYTLSNLSGELVKSSIVNLEQVSSIFAFDFIFQNSDRHSGNALIVKHNDGGRPKWKYYMIDHAWIFSHKPWNELNQNFNPQKPGNPWKFGIITRPLIINFCDMFDKLTRVDYDEILSYIPDSFLANSDDRTVLCLFLTTQLKINRNYLFNMIGI